MKVFFSDHVNLTYVNTSHGYNASMTGLHSLGYWYLKTMIRIQKMSAASIFE